MIHRTVRIDVIDEIAVIIHRDYGIVQIVQMGHEQYLIVLLFLQISELLVMIMMIIQLTM